jgi:hypothetical protein
LIPGRSSILLFDTACDQRPVGEPPGFDLHPVSQLWVIAKFGLRIDDHGPSTDHPHTAGSFDAALELDLFRL